MPPKIALKTKTLTYVAIAAGVCVIGTGLSLAAIRIYNQGYSEREIVYENFNACLCGNKKVDKGEQCDDGNRINGDGCGVNCVKEVASEVKFDGVNMKLGETRTLELTGSVGRILNIKDSVLSYKKYTIEYLPSNPDDGEIVTGVIQINKDGRRIPCLEEKVIQIGGEYFTIMSCGPLVLRRGDNLAINKKECDPNPQIVVNVRSVKNTITEPLEEFYPGLYGQPFLVRAIGGSPFAPGSEMETFYGVDAFDEKNFNLANFEFENTSDKDIFVDQIVFSLASKYQGKAAEFNKIIGNFSMTYNEKNIAGQTASFTQPLSLDVTRDNFILDEENEGFYYAKYYFSEKMYLPAKQKKILAVRGDIKKIGQYRKSNNDLDPKSDWNALRVGIKHLIPSSPTTIKKANFLDIKASNDAVLFKAKSFATEADSESLFGPMLGSENLKPIITGITFIIKPAGLSCDVETNEKNKMKDSSEETLFCYDSWRMLKVKFIRKKDRKLTEIPENELKLVAGAKAYSINGFEGYYTITGEIGKKEQFDLRILKLVANRCAPSPSDKDLIRCYEVRVDNTGSVGKSFDPGCGYRTVSASLDLAKEIISSFKLK